MTVKRYPTRDKAIAAALRFLRKHVQDGVCIQTSESAGLVSVYEVSRRRSGPRTVVLARFYWESK